MAADPVSRVEPRTGQVTTFASGLPAILPGVGIGGAMDIASIGKTTLGDEIWTVDNVSCPPFGRAR